MAYIQYVHWKAEEAPERAARLEGLGLPVVYEMDSGLPGFLRRLRSDPPAAVVIDLSRLPSQGRDLAVQLRYFATTRKVPLVLAGGEPEKVAAIRERIPDAVYTAWEEVRPALQSTLAAPPSNPVKPRSTMDGYAGRPLAQKLGLKPGLQVALVGAPEGFTEMLRSLEPAADYACALSPDCGLALWFIHSRAELEQRIDAVASSIQFGKLWMIWAKKGSAAYAGLSQQEARDAGLARGLGDYKVCAIDETWSGLLFARRKERKK